MHPLAAQVVDLFSPELQRVASELQQKHPGLQFNVWQGQVGSATEYQGYALGVECIFPTTSENATSNVALCIDLCHLTTSPRIMADVAWGYPSGQSEAALRENCHSSTDWPEATPEAVQELKTAFPKLAQTFQSSVERGTPPPRNKEPLFEGATWRPFENGRSVGSQGSEHGVIVLDEEHPADARITLERDGETAPLAITCGLAGWFVHTVFISTETEAESVFQSMKAALDNIIGLVPPADGFTRAEVKAVEEAIRRFVERFQ